MLDKVLGVISVVPDKKAPEKKMPPPAPWLADLLDLTTMNTGDPDRMIEIDAVLFAVNELEDTACGFNFLQLINFNFNYFANTSNIKGIGYTAPAAAYGNLFPPIAGPVTGAVAPPLSQWSWITSAAANYNVNIANAVTRRVVLLSQPHLATSSGTQAKSLEGGELIYRVSGLNSDDIRPYPFGTTLNVTPTLLRTPAEDGSPRVQVVVEVGRTSILNLLSSVDPNFPTPFSKVTVSGQAVLSVGQTLLLGGLAQRERVKKLDGVPGLRSIPVVKYLFSTEAIVDSKTAMVVLLTPRDPAFWGQQNQIAIKEFVEKRRAFLQAQCGSEADIQAFRERYPDWDQLPPSRFSAHLIMSRASDMYRAVAGTELASEDIDLEILGSSRGKTKRP